MNETNHNILTHLKGKEIIRHFYSGFNWAVLTLGASELIFILIGPFSFLFATFTCAVIFVFFLIHLEQKRKSFKKISRTFLLCTVELILLKLIYNYFVRLEFPIELLNINILAIIIFVITGYITASILPRFSNVT